LTARIPLLYLLDDSQPSWLLSEEDKKVLGEIREIRTTTSKKDAQIRRLELVRAMSGPLLDLIAAHAETLMESSFGCQFVSEVLFGAVGDKAAALNAVATWAENKSANLDSPHSGRTLKALVQGGPFDRKTKSVKLVEPALNFADLLYEKIKDNILPWASGPDSFVIVAMLEAKAFAKQQILMKQLKQYRSQLEQVGKTVAHQEGGNAGARILVQKLGEA